MPNPAKPEPGKRGRKSAWQGHECCGSKGRKHKKDCPAPENRTSSGNRKVNDRHPFSEGTYSMVKNALEVQGVDDIVREKGLDLLEVRRVNLADSYEEYLEIA